MSRTPSDCANGDQVRAASAFVLPGIDYGVSPHHRFLPGTINIGPQLFIDLVSSIVRQLADAGFDRLLAITGHGGILAALGVVQQSLLSTHPDFVFAYAPVSALATEATAALARTEVSGHCGESETSQRLAIDESLVDSGHLNPGATRLDDLDPRARLSRTKSPSTAVTFDRYADNGVRFVALGLASALVPRMSLQAAAANAGIDSATISTHRLPEPASRRISTATRRGSARTPRIIALRAAVAAEL
ncbi:MAG: creatininase family protein [Brevibacterium sp.]|uniref:creatininase family protein n=1 Tax=Brevibacterium sp. TaxID=1701 RepID=UPI003F93CD58